MAWLMLMKIMMVVVLLLEWLMSTYCCTNNSRRIMQCHCCYPCSGSGIGFEVWCFLAHILSGIIEWLTPTLGAEIGWLAPTTLSLSGIGWLDLGWWLAVGTRSKWNSCMVKFISFNFNFLAGCTGASVGCSHSYQYFSATIHTGLPPTTVFTRV